MQRGHYTQVLTKIEEILTKISSKYDFMSNSSESSTERDGLEYLFFKLKYTKAKVLRKTRMHMKADALCQELIDFIRTKMPKLAIPAIATPAVGAALGGTSVGGIAGDSTTAE